MGATPLPSGEAAGAPRAARAAGGPVLLFVGRLVPEKGVDDLVDAVRLLAETLPTVGAVVVGDGPARGALEQRARELGVASRVRFLGWGSQQDVQRELQLADIFVGPSRRAPDGTQEAQGVVFAEAMLAGLPVIATAVGGIGDAIQHESTGLIVAPGSPAEIAAAVRRLAMDPGLARRLASSARAFAERELTREVAARRFAAAYEGLLARQAQGGSREKT
jgi:glycosyltransferase involved in cell wall biosynthesis